MDRLVLASLALLVAALCFGPMRLYRSLGLHKPAAQLVRVLKLLVRKLNRQQRSTGTRVYRGMILLLVMGALALLLGRLVEWLPTRLPWLQLLELAVIAYLIPLRVVRDEVAEVGRQIKRRNRQQATSLLETLARRESAGLDDAGMLRVSIEYLAENWNDKIVSPLLWYIALGLPGLCLLRMVNLLDHLVGHRSKTLLAFGWAPAKLDDVMQWIPARLSALLLCLAAMFIPRCHPLKGLLVMVRHARRTASPNAGWPLAAMAGLLHISVGGPRRQEGAVIEDAWIGLGSARVERRDFRRALAVYAVACLLLWLGCLIALALLTNPQLLSITDLADRLQSLISGN